MTLSVNDFIERWKESRLKERSACQSHFNDLCDVLGQPHPTDADQVGTFYCFEKPATKPDGSRGFADVWKERYFGWEYKGPKEKDLGNAYRQLLDYRESLGNPPILVVSDLQNVEVHTNFNNTRPAVYRFNITNLESGDHLPNIALTPLEVLEAVFTNADVLRPDYVPSVEELDFLRRQLAAVQNKQPKLRVVAYEEGHEIETLVLPIDVLEFAQADIEAAWKEEAYATKPIYPPIYGTLPISMIGPWEPSNESRQLYARKREKYLTDYREYLNELTLWTRSANSTAEIVIAVVNDSNVSASDMIVQLFFPTNFAVYEELSEEIPPKPDAPNRPREPQGVLQPRAFDYGMLAAIPTFDARTWTKKQLPSHKLPPEITTEAARTKVEWRRDKIQSHYTLPLTPIAVTFPSMEGNQYYEIPYRIYADGIEPIAGTIGISTIGRVRRVNLQEHLLCLDEEVEEDE